MIFDAESDFTRKRVLSAAPVTVRIEKRIQQFELSAEVLKYCQKIVKKGEDGSQLRINLREPEAVVQKLKHGKGFSTAYKASVLVNSGRIIVAQTVVPSSEIKVIPDLLAKSFNL